MGRKKKLDSRWGCNREVILKLLEQEGELTRLEAEEIVGEIAARMLHRLAKPSKLYGKRAYICRYVMDAEGARRYPRAVYKLGDKPDAKKPPPSPRKTQPNYAANLVKRAKASSIFRMGATLESMGLNRDGRPLKKETEHV